MAPDTRRFNGTSTAEASGDPDDLTNSVADLDSVMAKMAKMAKAAKAVTLVGHIAS